ncbi:MAG: molybdenum cofactor biosynthesis protein MoaE [Chitinophagaceae bacterium]
MKNIFHQGAISPSFIADSIAKHSSKHTIGAHSIFMGQVRADEQQGERVNAINYTAYEEMALQCIHQLREKMFEKYELICMHVYHSLGRVPCGEICLFVFVSSKHRRNAIRACEELVEGIKKELPIWGEELFENEKKIWKQNN